MQKKKRYFLSKDDPIFVESADKYVPALTKKQLENFIREPLDYKKISFKNIRLFAKFCQFLIQKLNQIGQAKSSTDFVEMLLLFYLFQSSMDHHYYQYDRYLLYEDYKNTPVGFWWNKFREIIAHKINADQNDIKVHNQAIKLLTIKEIETDNFFFGLNKDDQRVLQKAITTIKIYSEMQQKIHY